MRQSVGEYVDGHIHTNGIESLWSMLKRAHKAVYHKLSEAPAAVCGGVRWPPEHPRAGHAGSDDGRGGVARGQASQVPRPDQAERAALRGKVVNDLP